MGKCAYLFNDYIKDLVAGKIGLVDAGGSCVNANYPIANLQNEQIALRTWTDAKVAVKLQFELAATKALRTFFIGNHNFSGGTFDINSYTANNYVTGKVTVETAKAIRLLDVYHYESSAPITQQWWEIDLTNVTTADSVFKIGRFMAYDGSNPVQITDKEDYILPRGYGFKNLINETAYGVRWVHKLTEKRERLELSWGQRTVANAIHTELRTLYELVYGDAHPFVFIPDIDYMPCFYVYIEDAELLYSEIFNIQTSGSHIGGLKLRLIEAIRGKI